LTWLVALTTVQHQRADWDIYKEGLDYTVRKISGKYSNSKIHHLEVNGDEVTYIPHIANSLAQSFSQNSSSQPAENNRLSLKSKNMTFGLAVIFQKAEERLPSYQFYQLASMYQIRAATAP